MVAKKLARERRQKMPTEDALDELITCFQDSPYPSVKVTNYFQIYVELFAHLRGTRCTFIETGVLNGGSLFMWRNWLGEQARIIGIDLNPEAQKWTDAGFEIYTGDQANPTFWRETFEKIGDFDALLDDGGHQSFQQIVTLNSALHAAKKQCVIAIEDTCTSFFKEFSGHHQYSFTEYCKDATDTLLAKASHFYDGQFPAIRNTDIVKRFSSVESIQFFSGIVAYKVNPKAQALPEVRWNKLPETMAADYRYDGTDGATIDWPDLFTKKTIMLKGGEK